MHHKLIYPQSAPCQFRCTDIFILQSLLKLVPEVTNIWSTNNSKPELLKLVTF